LSSLSDLLYYITTVYYGHMSARGQPLHFMFGPRVGFSGSADRMALFPVGPNSIGTCVCRRKNARGVIRLSQSKVFLVHYVRLFTVVSCAYFRNIYAALGVYRINPPTNWPVSELETQIEISRDTARRDFRSLGNILFSAKYFRDNVRGVRDAFKYKVYTKNADIPSTAHPVYSMQQHT